MALNGAEPRSRRCNNVRSHKGDRSPIRPLVKSPAGTTAQWFLAQKKDAEHAEHGRDRQERRAEYRDAGHSVFFASSTLSEWRINRSAASAVPMRI
jgi:hypothetical protein